MDRWRVPLAFFALFGNFFAILDRRWPEITVAFYLDG